MCRSPVFFFCYIAYTNIDRDTWMRFIQWRVSYPSFSIYVGSYMCTALLLNHGVVGIDVRLREYKINLVTKAGVCLILLICDMTFLPESSRPLTVDSTCLTGQFFHGKVNMLTLRTRFSGQFLQWRSICMHVTCCEQPVSVIEPLSWREFYTTDSMY